MIELWSSNHDAYSHRCRIVICEKDLGLERGIAVEIKDIDINNKPEDLARINPNNQVPVLVDRDLHLYESSIICEYLDEHFPHPQLMPVAVPEKGKARLMMHQFDRMLYSKMDKILAARSTRSNKTNEHRALLAESLLMLAQNMGKNKYMVGNELTMVDVNLAPLLWRLEFLEVKLPLRAAPLLKYAETVFARPSFVKSLTPMEKEMRR